VPETVLRGSVNDFKKFEDIKKKYERL